jgi:hypothetical protein
MSFVKVLITTAILGCAAYLLLFLNLIAIKNEIDLLVLVAIIALGSVFIAVYSDLYSDLDVQAGTA